MSKKKASAMSRAELMAVPRLPWDAQATCASLIVIPGSGSRRRFHDSGFRAMSFVAADEDDNPIGLIGGGSDVIHLDGIGGFGFDWLDKYGKVPDLVPPSGWNVDCLPKSGFLRFFCDGKIKCGPSLSSMEIYAVRRPRP